MSMSRTKIIASDLTNLTDARYFAAWEVDWIGFNLDAGSEHYLDPLKAMAIREWVDGPAIAGAFGLAEADEILQRVSDLRLDTVLAGMFVSADTVRTISERVPVIREIVVEKTISPDTIEQQLEELAPFVEYFLLNFDKNAIHWTELKSGKWALDNFWLRECCVRYPVLVSIDLDPQVLEDLLAGIRPAGFNLRGGEEEKVGFKSFDQLDALLDILRGQ